MQTDRYGVAVSTASTAARDAYVEAVDLLLTVYPGATEAFDRAVAADPGFALAHIGKARARQLAGDLAAMRDSLATAQTLCDGGPARNRSQIEGFTVLRPTRARAAAGPRPYGKLAARRAGA